MDRKYNSVLDDLGHKVRTSDLKNSVRGKVVFVQNAQNMPYSVVCARTVREFGITITRAFDEKIDKMADIDCDCLVLPEIRTVN